ncbi:DMT family transporter [Roseibium aggregatum]|uniref:DMT family transporter n=1 Tax=Roseibium aggregatum TaxID=187304 RepID=UPI003A97951E
MLTGILSITGAVLLLSLSDALVKLNSDGVALGQLLLVRSVVAAVLLALVLAVTGTVSRVERAVTIWVWLRSLCLALMWGCYYAALPLMPLSLAAACYYTSPLWMAVLTSVFLGRPVGVKGSASIALGLSGVVILLRPGVGDVSPVVVLPLLAGFFYALAAVITSARCRYVPPLALAFNLNLVLAGSGGVYVAVLHLVSASDGAGFLLSAWPALSLSGWGLLMLLGLLLAVITVAVACAYQLAPAPLIGLFDNGYLVFAVVWAVLFFADVPDRIDLTGIALIGCAALLASVPIAVGRRCPAPKES